MLITTLSAYMRRKLMENEHKPGWEDEKFGDLLIGLHEEKYEWLDEIRRSDSSVESMWGEAADLCNYIAMVTDAAVKKRMKIIDEFRIENSQQV